MKPLFRQTIGGLVMSRYLVIAIVPLMLLAFVGCQSDGKMVRCEKCDKKVAKGAYCGKCNKVMGYSGQVHCKGCDRDFEAGEYCGKCKRFVLAGKVHCDKCGKDMPKGKYCAKCGKYMGIKGVAHCKRCDMPYAKGKGCPHCK
jgi:hypothetical protein